MNMIVPIPVLFKKNSKTNTDTQGIILHSGGQRPINYTITTSVTGQTFAPPLATCLDFVTAKFKEGCGYSSVNTARTAITTFYDNVKYNPMIVRFMKGVFNLRPSLSQYTCTWDVTDVLNNLKTLPLPNLT